MDGEREAKLRELGWKLRRDGAPAEPDVDILLDMLIGARAARELAVKTLGDLVGALPECEECGAAASGMTGGYPACDECRSGDGMDHEYAAPLRAAQALLQRAEGRR